MSVAILGGIRSLEGEYKKIMKKHSIKYKLFNQHVTELSKKIKNVDGIVLFTNTVSHKMAKESSRVCKKNCIKMIKTHSSSLTSLENIIAEFTHMQNCTGCKHCQK